MTNADVERVASDCKKCGNTGSYCPECGSSGSAGCWDLEAEGSCPESSPCVSCGRERGSRRGPTDADVERAPMAKDFTRDLALAKAHAAKSPIWERFSGHTPLRNDVPVWMVEFAYKLMDQYVRAAIAAMPPSEREKELEDALRFYALNWEKRWQIQQPTQELWDDHGKLARAVLAKERADG